MSHGLTRPVLRPLYSCPCCSVTSTSLGYLVRARPRCHDDLASFSKWCGSYLPMERKIHMNETLSRATNVLAGIVVCLSCLANVGCVGLSTSSKANSQAADPVLPAYNISGTISPSANGGGVTVTLSGPNGASTTTDDSGNYSFSGLSSSSFTLTPSKPGLSFTPSSRTMTANGLSIAGLDFTSSSPSQLSGPIVINGKNGT